MRFIFTLTSVLGTETIINPIGWEDISMMLVRDNFHGVSEGFPTKFGYHSDGYAHLKSLYDTYGIQADCSLLVEFACSDTDPYETLYQGVFDFTDTVIKEQECIIEIPAEPSSCNVKFLNRLDEKVLIPTDQTITVPTKTIIKKARIDNVASTAQAVKSLLLDAPAGSSYPVEGFMKSAIRFFGDTLSFQDNPMELNNFYELLDIGSYLRAVGHPFDGEIPNPAPIASTEFFFVAPVNGEYTFNYDVNADIFVKVNVGSPFTEFYTLTSCPAPSNVFGFNEFKTQLALEIIHADGSAPVIVVLDSNDVDSCYVFDTYVPQNLNVSGATAPLTLQAGDGVNLVMKVSHGASDFIPSVTNIQIGFYQTVTMNAGSYLQVTLDDNANYPPVPVKMAMIDEVFSSIIDTVSQGCLSFDSSYFGRTDGVIISDQDGCGALEGITTGLHIRKFADASLYASMKQMYDAINGIHNIGIGIIGTTVLVDVVREFYLGSISILLNDVKNLRIKFDESLVFNNLIVGYQKWESEEYNGLDEFNTKREYSNGISQARGNKNVQSSLIASAYAAELAKRNDFATTGTKDLKYDNELFIFALARDGGDFVVDQGRITGSGNIIDPTNIYNYELSPARIALRWFKTAIVGVKDFANSVLYFKYGDGNYTARGHWTGRGGTGDCVEEIIDPLIENQDIEYDMLADGYPLFTGEIIEIDEINLTKTQYDTIKANRLSLIGVSGDSSGTYHYGWIKDLKYFPNKGIVKLTLLKKP